MRRLCLVLMLLSLSVVFPSHRSHAQSDSGNLVPTNPVGIEECQKRSSVEIFPAETCAIIASHLARGEKLGEGPLEDGSFLVVSSDVDGKSIGRIDHLPPRLRSEIALKSVTETVRDVRSVSERQLCTAVMSEIRDIYCHYHPEEAYTDVSGNTLQCAEQTPLPDDKTVETEFEYVVVCKSDLLYSTLAENTQSLGSRTGPASSQSSSPTVIATNQKTDVPSPGVSTAAGCEKNISFAVTESSRIVSRVPSWVQTWIGKNQRKYPGLCFSQSPNPQASNFLLVLSASQTAFNGLYPTVRTSTSTSTTPVSGSGVVTDNYGGMWNYSYNGTVTTTTMTATHENVPYTDTSNTLFLYGYNQQGRLVSEHWRTITTRQGGDGANTLGYNLGTALGAIHMKQHLLKNVVEDVTKGPK